MSILCSVKAIISMVTEFVYYSKFNKHQDLIFVSRLSFDIIICSKTIVLYVVNFVFVFSKHFSQIYCKFTKILKNGNCD